MKWRVKVICVDAEGKECRHAVLELKRQRLAMETLGLNLREGKAILESVQTCLCRRAGSGGSRTTEAMSGL